MKKILPVFLAVILLVGCKPKAEAVKEPHSEADLAGMSVGTMTGTIYDIEYTKQPEINLSRFTTISDAIAALRQGRVDAIICDEFSVNSDVMRENGIKKAFLTGIGFPLGFAFKKSDMALADSLDALLNDLKASGQLDSILNKWLDPNAEFASIKMLTDALPTPTGKPITIGTSINLAPVTYAVGNSWRGIEAEIYGLFGQYTGRPVQTKLMDFSALAPALQAGTIDIMAGGIFITEERQKAFHFTQPYYSCYGACYVRDPEAQASTGFWQGIKRSFNNNLLVEDRWKFLTSGLGVTIEITLFSLLFGTMLGAGLYLMRKSRRRWVRAVASTYSAFMRGIPMVVLLMILFYVVLTGINAVAVAVVAFSMSFASFVASIMDTSIDAVGNGQREAGLASGFSPWKTFRYIIGPQALRRALPHFKDEAVALVKGTSIVGYIAIQDITRAGDMIRSRTFEAFLPLLIITIIYFLLAWLLSKLMDALFKLGMKI